MAKKRKEKKITLPAGKVCSLCHRRIRIGDAYLHLDAMSHTEDGPREFLEEGDTLVHLHHYACSPSCAREIVERMSGKYMKGHHV